MASSPGGRWPKFNKGMSGVAIGESEQGSGEPIVRIDARQLAVLDEHGAHRPVVTAVA